MRSLARSMWRWGLAGFASSALAVSALAQTTIVEYIHTDALGSPVAVTNAAGAVVERQVYEPYGAGVTRGPNDGPGFTGHVEDSVTGLTYMQQRYYDPQLARFLSVDSVPVYGDPVGSLNRYWYANNSPYKFTDPDGRKACGNDTGCRLAQGEAGGAVSGIPQAPTNNSAGPKSSDSSYSKWDDLKGRIGLKGDLTKNGNILDMGALAHDIFYPLMDSPAGPGFKLAGLGLLAATMRAEGRLVFSTGHYASRLDSVGLNVSRVEAIVAREVVRIRPYMAVGADISGRMKINEVLVEYRVRALPDGTVNVRTIFPVK